MNIAVMSPHAPKNGTTTIAALLSHELSMKNKKVCLTHAKTKSNSLFSFFNINESDDKTANPIEISKLIIEGGIRKNDISAYCKGITENLELFTINSNEIDQGSYSEVLDFICKSFPHDYTIFDIDTEELSSLECRTILNNCDCIVYIFTQNNTELHEFKKEKLKYYRYIRNIPNIVVVNKFNGIIGSMDDVACAMGLKKASKWVKVSYNPYIAWGTNEGKLLTVFELMKKRDYRLVDTDSDIKNLIHSIMSIKKVVRANKINGSYAREEVVSL